MRKDDHSSHILDLAKKLIAIPSTEDNPVGLEKALAIAKKEIQGYFPVEKFESNGIQSILVHNTDKRIRHFKVILNAHLDVIPGIDNQFIPYEKDGKLYGRGAYDMKAAAAVMIVLFKEIAGQLSYPLGLQITTDEETAGENGTRYQLKKAVRADFAVMGECGSNFRIVNEAKTTLNLKLKTRGYAAHGAYPWKGKNAILAMNQALDRLMKIYPIPKEESFETTINIARIETENIAYNIVPDNCTAYLDVRFISKDKDKIVEKIQSLLGQEITIKILHSAIQHYANPDNEYIKILKKSSEEILGKSISVIRQHATSDARFFSEVGCAAVEFGPIGRGQHQDIEWVDIKSLKHYYKILENFLLSLD